MADLPHFIWIGFAGGVISFAHCLGMCGGFMLHLSRGPGRKQALQNQLSWLAGKLMTYLFLGALAGYSGGYLGALLPRIGLLQDLLSYLAGAVLLLAGLSLFGLLPTGSGSGGIGAGVLATLGGSFLVHPAPGPAALLGAVTGFLPCPTLLGFLAYSLSTGSVTGGMAVMGALGVGTAIPLLLLGGASSLSGLHLRRWAAKAGGIILVVLGFATALRGTALSHHLLGCSSVPPPASGAVAAPCCPGTHHATGNGN